MNKHLQINNCTIPSFMYGTAWKEEKTKELVIAAIDAGFRAIDTANQRKHYCEAAVGEAVDFLICSEKIKREDLFLQTKFTYVRGQDHRLPYNPNADFATQVQQSFASSLEHLQTSYLDSYVLHGPSSHPGLSSTDEEVWQAMTEFYRTGKTKLLGISNVNYDQLATLVEKAKTKPHFVQNRCFARSKWDKKIRNLCKEHNIVYQGFSLLTANRAELARPKIAQIAEKHACTVAQLVFRFSLGVGMMPLTGTTNIKHMEEDLKMYDVTLNDREIETIENIAFIE